LGLVVAAAAVAAAAELAVAVFVAAAVPGVVSPTATGSVAV